MEGEVPVRRTILRRQARPNGNEQPATLPFTNTPFPNRQSVTTVLTFRKTFTFSFI